MTNRTPTKPNHQSPMPSSSPDLAISASMLLLLLGERARRTHERAVNFLRVMEERAAFGKTAGQDSLLLVKVFLKGRVEKNAACWKDGITNKGLWLRGER